MEMKDTSKKLKDIFLLLVPENDCPLSEEDQIRKKELVEFFEHLNIYSRRLNDYFHCTSTNNFYELVPRFLHLLRECLLTHQWQKALKLITALSNEARGQDSTMWKVGLACLFQDEERNSRLIQQFVNQVYILKGLAVVEVMLDYLLFLILKLNIEDAKGLVQELKLKTLFCSQLTNERRSMAHTLFFAYQGLVLYVEWKMVLMKIDDEEMEMDLISQKLSQGATANSARSIADRAVEYLITVKDLPGIWDIFISRIVEIYEYYGNTDEARKLLTSYRDRNASNPNAHFYLYKFEMNQDENPETRLDCLKQILRLDPSNELCLTLYNLLEEFLEPKSVVYLFDFLDYEHCCHNEDVWEALADKLCQVNDNPLLAEIVREQWDIRRKWWPQTRLSITTNQIKISTRCQSLIQRVKDSLLCMGNDKT
ncbi:TATA box-binding protein-associated factor RNA polymerase I subunit A [Biomphalaria pfeifferi]|uniref:TATA box-binding protein-associated factor RNA polymerase I subunit A n=1 Tax=Biomphalaria pfeifferi TaxID=112525 RepID=A0AAD8FCR2_BIOPF|nr:TATA box-binding protein-associated factor RNA polymerase I subunit A [Biomphalaria pfeifferi]